MIKLGPFTFTWQVIDDLLHLYVTAPFTKIQFYQAKAPPAGGHLIGHWNVPVSQAPYIVCSASFRFILKASVVAYVADTTTALRAGVLKQADVT